MEKVRLKDLDCFISDGNYSSKYPRSDEFVKEGIPFIRCNNFKNNTITKEDMYYITKEKHSVLQKGHLKQGDILITTRGSLGQVVIVPKEYEDANINAQIVLLRVNKEKIYNRYLMWQLKSRNIQNQIMKNKTGTALPQLPISKLEKIEFLVVEDIEEQIAIATKLDKIQDIVDMRKKQIEDLEELIKFQFVEMFGRVELNDKKFEEQEMRCIADISSSKRIYADEYQENGIPFYRSKEIIELGHNKKPSIELFISKNRYEEIKDKYGIPKKGDILITAVGTIGETWIVDTDEPFYYKDGNVLQIRLNTDISQIYFKYVLDTLISIFKNKNVSGSAYSALTIEKFKKMKIILPPITLQNQFADIVKQINKQRFAIQKSLEEMQKLQESLMNKYFWG